MSSYRLVRAINWLLVAIVVSTPLFYWKWALYPYAVPKTALFEALVELLFALWVALAISDKRYRPRMTPLAWAVVVYLGILTIAAFTGVDPWRSFFSDLERAFGIVMYYHLAAFALVISSMGREIPWKKIWYASFGTSLVTVGIAIIQLKITDFLLASDSAGGRPGSTFGNPTFLAGYLLVNIFVAGWFLIENGKRKMVNGGWEIFFLWGTVLLDVVGVFITETRGDIFGLFAGIFVLAVLFAVHPPAAGKRSFYIALIIILVVVAGGVWLTRSSSIWNNVPGLDRLKDLTISGSNSDIQPRLMAASAAWSGFLDRPIFGWGFENFNVVFNRYYNPKVLEYGYAESDFDKPHDVPLEMLDAGGIFLLLAYLAMLGVAVYQAQKKGGRLFGQFIAAALVAYFVRSLVIFDTIGPAMMLFLVFAWVDGAAMQGEVRNSERISRQASAVAKAMADKRDDGCVNKVVFLVAIILAAIFIYALNGTAFAAGDLDWEARENLQILNNPTVGLADFREEAATWNVYQWDFIRDYVNTVAQAYFYDESAIPQSDVQYAIGLMEQVAVEHPNDAYNHYLLTDVYNLAYDIDPKDYLAEAEVQAQIALQLSPNRQEIYFYLEKTKSLEGNYPAALALAKQALALDPNVADSHFYYGMLAFATGDNTTGYNEVETAINMGRQWADYHEPEVAGDYFANSGHLTDAIGLYQTALSMEPTDYDAEAKLGAAYYLTGNSTLAKQYLSDAASKLDFSSSPAYSQYEPILQALGIQ